MGVEREKREYIRCIVETAKWARFRGKQIGVSGREGSCPKALGLYSLGPNAKHRVTKRKLRST